MLSCTLLPIQTSQSQAQLHPNCAALGQIHHPINPQELCSKSKKGKKGCLLRQLFLESFQQSVLDLQSQVVLYETLQLQSAEALVSLPGLKVYSDERKKVKFLITHSDKVIWKQPPATTQLTLPPSSIVLPYVHDYVAHCQTQFIILLGLIVELHHSLHWKRAEQHLKTKPKEVSCHGIFRQRVAI